MRTTITPEKAREILKNNKGNRKINAANLAIITKEIELGNFKYNGESIIIAKSGLLLNGQHRLQGCVDADAPIEVNLVEGVDEGVMTTIDTGKPRNAGDVLFMKNVKNSTFIASTIRGILEKMGKARRYSKGGTSVKVTNQEILDFYLAHKDTLTLVTTFASHIYSSGAKILTPTQISAQIYLLGYEDPKGVINFFRELITGVFLTDSNAAQALRTKLINSKISKINFNERQKVNLIIKSFRLYIEGKNRKTIRVSSDEDIRYLEMDLTKEPKFDRLYIEQHSI